MTEVEYVPGQIRDLILGQCNEHEALFAGCKACQRAVDNAAFYEEFHEVFVMQGNAVEAYEKNRRSANEVRRILERNKCDTLLRVRILFAVNDLVALSLSISKVCTDQADAVLEFFQYRDDEQRKEVVLERVRQMTKQSECWGTRSKRVLIRLISTGVPQEVAFDIFVPYPTGH